MTECLIVLNPREIPDCVGAIEALNVPKCWLSYMTEPEACRRMADVVRRTDFDRYLILSDDGRPTQYALDKVLEAHDAGHPVVTGYSNLDAHLPYVNLTRNVLPPPPPTVDSYKMLTQEEVGAEGGIFSTTFAGLCLTVMSRDMWLRYPLTPSSLGGQTDYMLSYALAQDEVPIVAHAAAFVHHVKEVWNQADTAPEKRLLVGERPAEVRWTGLPPAREVDGKLEIGPPLQVKQPPQPPRAGIIGLLCFYDEARDLLAQAVAGLKRAGCHHVVAVDGAYALYPDAKPASDLNQLGAIAAACQSLEMGCSLHVPQAPWAGNEVQKRTFLFDAGLVVADPGDWFLVMDADQVCTIVPSDLGEVLYAAEEDVAEFTIVDMEALVAKRPDWPERFGMRSLFRAQPIYLDTNHFTYRTYDGRTLWAGERDEGERRDEEGNVTTEPRLDLRHEMIVQHFPQARPMERLLSKNAYYTSRDEEAAEAGACAKCGEPATRRMSTRWRKENKVPVADIAEFCDRCGREVERYNRSRLRGMGLNPDEVKIIERNGRLAQGVAS